MCLLGDIHAIHDLKGNVVASIRHQQHTKASVKQLQTLWGPADANLLAGQLHARQWDVSVFNACVCSCPGAASVGHLLPSMGSQEQSPVTGRAQQLHIVAQYDHAGPGLLDKCSTLLRCVVAAYAVASGSWTPRPLAAAAMTSHHTV